MPHSESPSAHYRRLAQECLEVAEGFAPGERRSAVLQMAQVWQRLADERADSTMPPFSPPGGEPAPMQQQQQIQPKDEDKKE